MLRHGLIAGMVLAALACQPVEKSPDLAAGSRATVQVAKVNSLAASSPPKPPVELLDYMLGVRDYSRTPAAVQKLFAAWGAEISPLPLTDYGQHASTPKFARVAPSSITAVVDILAAAWRSQVPVRVRGAGHSRNGSSLPQPGELLLETKYLDAYALPASATVDAEAGIPIRALDQYLSNRYGWGLPVANDGVVLGPTLGGFIAAGGISGTMVRYGGFWENVRWLDLVDFRGRLWRIAADDPRFPWIFGAQGRLGVVVRARLDLIGKPPLRPFPLGQAGRARTWLNDLSSWPVAYDRSTFWLTLFADGQRAPAVEAELKRLMAVAASDLTFREPFHFETPFIRFHPPLLFPWATTLHAVGVWGQANGPSGDLVRRQLEAALGAYALAQTGVTRYHQSEYTSQAGDENDWRRFWSQP